MFNVVLKINFYGIFKKKKREIKKNVLIIYIFMYFGLR